VNLVLAVTATTIALAVAPARAQTIEAVRKAVDGYFADGDAKAESRAALVRWGNAALPFLRELAGKPEDVGLLESLMPVRAGDWDLVCAIDQVGTPEAIDFLIEILDGKTAVATRQALHSLMTATRRHRELLRSHLRFQQLVFKFAKADDGPLSNLGRSVAANIIADLGWEDGEPLLELMLQSDDLRLRQNAAEAIEKLTGRKVEIRKPDVAFPSESPAEALWPLSRLQRTDLRGRFEVWFDGHPTLILGSETALSPHDAGLAAGGPATVPLHVKDILSLPLAPRRWRWVVLGNEPGAGWSSDPALAVCLDERREELWRYEPQRDGIETACRLYAPDRCLGVAFGAGGAEGVVAFSSDGEELFRRPRTYVTYGMSSHPRVPDCWLRCGGNLALYDNRGNLVAGGPAAPLDMRKVGGHYFHARHAVLAAGFDGSATVVAAGSGRNSEPRIVRFDDTLRALWSATLPDRITALALLDPGDREPLCAATTDAGDLFVFDLAGTLRQRLRLVDDASSSLGKHGLSVDSISAGPLDDDRYGLAVGLLSATIVYEMR